MTRLIFLFLLPLAIISCSTSEQNSEPISVTIIHLNDVYEIGSVNRGKEGGFARLKTLIDSLKQENPNLLVLHAGDFLNPSLIGNLRDSTGKKIRGRQMIEVMNGVGIDYVTFGNHEFDIKESELLERLNESEFGWISANVGHVIPNQGIAPFKVREVPISSAETFNFYQDQDTFQLGLTAVTLPFNQKEYVFYEDFEKSVANVLDTIHADRTILLTHLERDQDHSVAKKFPKVPLIMGGHDHFHFMDNIGNTIIAKADANLRTVWKYNLKYYANKDSLAIYAELIQIDESIRENEEVNEVVERWQQFAVNSTSSSGFNLDRVIWSGEEIWECRETVVRTKQTNFGNMVAQAAKESTDSDVALINSGSLRYDDELRDVISEKDILKAMPFGGPVKVADIPGNALVEILKIGLNENKSIGGYLQVSGVEILENDFLINGIEIQTNQTYKVVTSDFVSAGREANLGGMSKFNWKTPEGLAKNDIRSIVIDFLSNQKKQ